MWYSDPHSRRNSNHDRFQTEHVARSKLNRRPFTRLTSNPLRLQPSHRHLNRCSIIAHHRAQSRSLCYFRESCCSNFHGSRNKYFSSRDREASELIWRCRCNIYIQHRFIAIGEMYSWSVCGIELKYAINCYSKLFIVEISVQLILSGVVEVASEVYVRMSTSRSMLLCSVAGSIQSVRLQSTFIVGAERLTL